MLGERVLNAAVESAATNRDEVPGFGLPPVETEFSAEKRVTPATRELQATEGPLAGAAGEATGYEIHMGETAPTADVTRPFDGHGATTDRVLGTYLHGLFENDVARRGFVEAVFDAADRVPPERDPDEREPATAAADLLRENANLDPFDLPTG
jgi:adenosylcobyric acid synthase